MVAALAARPNQIKGASSGTAEIPRNVSVRTTSRSCSAASVRRRRSGWQRATPITVAIAGRVVRGTAEQVAEQIKTNVLDVGVDAVIVNLSTRGYKPGVIAKVGEALKPLVSA